MPATHQNPRISTFSKAMGMTMALFQVMNSKSIQLNNTIILLSYH